MKIIQQLLLSSKVIKLGPGGLRSKDELKPAHRNIHVSHIGNMSAIATPESADVGITTHHTLSPLITNKYGSYGLKDPDSLTGWDTLAINEALIPLSSEVYSDRLVLATTHSGQVNGVAWQIIIKIDRNNIKLRVLLSLKKIIFIYRNNR